MEAEEGYELRGLTVTDASGNHVTVTNNTFTMPAGDVTVSAEIVRVYDVAVSITEGSGHGTVTADKSRAAQGDTVTVTVAPDAKYMPVLDEETTMPVTVTDGDGETVVLSYIDPDISNQFIFFMPDSTVTVKAAFVPAVYDILLYYTTAGELYPFENGSLAVTADGETVAEVQRCYPARPDQEIAVTVTPAPGYALENVTGVYNNGYQNIYDQALTLTQDTNNPNRWTFTMPDGAPYLEATMRKLPVVTFKVDDTEYATVPTDETGIVTPPDDPAKEGWQFAAWHQVVSGEMSETPFNFNTEITENITLKAAFSKLYTVTVSSGAGGTVTADPASAIAGKAIALDIQPLSGYILDTLTVTDGNGHLVTVANDAFTMPDCDVTVEATFTQNAPRFTDAALELGGVLNLRYYVAYPSQWDATGDYVVFTVNGVARTVAYADSAADSTGRYFPCPVNAYQMADRIDAVYYHGEAEVARQEDYSVEKNLQYLNGTTSGATQALVRATMNYGHYIQPYLAANNGWTLGETYQVMDKYSEIGSVSSDLASEYTHVWTTYQVKQATFALALEDSTTLRVKVTLNEAPSGTVTATAGDKTITPVHLGGNTWQIDLPGIPANALGIPYTFTLNVGQAEVFKLKISALSYVNLVLQYGNPSETEQKAMAALYAYGVAAKGQ